MISADFNAEFRTEALDCDVEYHVVNIGVEVLTIEFYRTGSTSADDTIDLGPAEFVTRAFRHASRVVIRSNGSDRSFNYRVSFLIEKIDDYETRRFFGVVHNADSKLKSFATPSCESDLEIQVENIRPSGSESNYKVTGISGGPYSLSLTYSDG